VIRPSRTCLRSIRAARDPVRRRPGSGRAPDWGDLGRRMGELPDHSEGNLVLRLTCLRQRPATSEPSGPAPLTDARSATRPPGGRGWPGRDRHGRAAISGLQRGGRGIAPAAHHELQRPPHRSRPDLHRGRPGCKVTRRNRGRKTGRHRGGALLVGLGCQPACAMWASPGPRWPTWPTMPWTTGRSRGCRGGWNGQS
jgi:hypothetical protein